jgi:hypothetical protein
MAGRIGRVLLYILYASFCVLLMASGALAQNKEVEIEVAGPWALVPDPVNAGRVMVVTPNSNHKITVIQGGNAYGFKGSLKPGVYMLDFKTAQCADHSPVPKPVPYDLKVDAAAIAKAIASKNLRVAISLPKPCYLGAYRRGFAKIDAKKIDANTPETTYSIWSSVHYTIENSTTSASLSGTLDSGANFKPVDVAFVNFAVSVVAYYANAGEDYPCDNHSAEHFDAAMSLWGKPGYYRLFPKLDDMGNQTDIYNYDPATCSQMGGARHAMALTSADSLLDRIDKIRNQLTDRSVAPTIKDVQELREAIFAAWSKKPPAEAQLDLDNGLKALQELQEKHESFPPALALSFLRVTEYFAASPGRADCHAMQLNIIPM